MKHRKPIVPYPMHSPYICNDHVYNVLQNKITYIQTLSRLVSWVASVTWVTWVAWVTRDNVRHRGKVKHFIFHR